MQSIWFSFRYFISQFFSQLFRAKHLPETIWQDEILNKLKNRQAVYFILKGRNAADQRVLENFIKSHLDKREYKSLLHFIHLPDHYIHPSKGMSPKLAIELSALLNQAAGKHSYLCHVFWGRQANRDNSFWTSYFSSQWSPAGRIRRSLAVLFNARNISCHAIPWQIEAEFELESTLADIDKALYDQRVAVTGPDLSHKRTLSQTVLQSERVQTCLQQLIDDGELQPKKAEKLAQKYIREIAADYSYSTLRFFDVILTWLWQKIYHGIELNGFERITKLAQSHQLVYVPCHRSHIDYLLLSYAIFHQGLMPPHIAAGINLNLPIVGSLLRKAGAFFIRRQFKGKQLYRAVFESYLQAMMQTGTPLEYFIEGGRSRTGLLLPPKPGMLAMTVNAALENNAIDKGKPVAFVPIYIGYEKMLESHSYINELYGKKKESESIKGLLSARKYLSLNFGKVYVNIAPAIMLNDVIDNYQSHTHASPAKNHEGSDSNKALVHHCVNDLGQQIQMAVNQAALITPANLVATALLAIDKSALLEHQLLSQIKLLSCIAKSEGFEVKSTDQQAQYAIDHALDLELILKKENAWGNILYLDQRAQINATFLRNNCLHAFMLPSIIASVLVRQNQLHIKKIINVCKRLLPFIQSELFVDINAENLSIRIIAILKLLEEKGLVIRQGDYYLSSDRETESFYQLQLLSGCSKAAIERFYITAQCLLHAKDQAYTSQSLEEACVELAQQLAFLHTFHAPDFFDKNLFRTFIQQLIKQTVINEDDKGFLEAKRRLHLSSKLASLVLSKHAQRSIRQLAYRKSLEQSEAKEA